MSTHSHTATSLRRPSVQSPSRPAPRPARSWSSATCCPPPPRRCPARGRRAAPWDTGARDRPGARAAPGGQTPGRSLRTCSGSEAAGGSSAPNTQ